MRFFLTKTFRFSASYGEDNRVFGHNYVLGVCVEAPSRQEEKRLVQITEDALIEKIASRDLTLHVDFLKEVPITDENLLKAFWKILEQPLKPLVLREIYLERDSRTRTTVRP